MPLDAEPGGLNMDTSASPRLAELIRSGMPALLEHHGHKLTAHQRRALRSIAGCRTGAFGATTMRCLHCGEVKTRLRSCGHRSCPQCQHHTASEWLERQRAKLLPVHYFMATFTLPPALRPIAYRNPKIVYPALFDAVANTLKSFGLNHPKLNAKLGFTAILHTHSRRLEYHPHLHVVIPGGGVDRRERKTPLWRKLHGKYLFNGFALAEVFRAKCLEALRSKGIELPDAIPRKWVVHCQHVGKGLPALKYLSRYLYRGVISDTDILHFDQRTQTVTFRYRDGKTKRFERRTLPIAEFLWRIAMHVLPKGLQRVRHYGFLHANAKRLLNLLQLVLRVIVHTPEPRTPRPFGCANCGSDMEIGPLVIGHTMA